MYGDPNGVEKALEFTWTPISFEHPHQHLVIRDPAVMRDSIEFEARYDRLAPILETLFH